MDRQRLSRAVLLRPPDPYRDGGRRRACRPWQSSSRSGGGGFALPAVLVVVGVGGLYVASTSGIYYTAKAYQVAAFPIACAVVAGAGALTRFPWPRFALPVALIGALLLGGEAAAFKLGIGFAARGAAVTPPEFRQLEKLGQHTPRRLGVALVHDDWTKALLPDAALPYDSSFGANVAPGHDIVGFLDVDALSPASLGRLYWLVEPSLGGVSTPPSPFRLTRATPEYRLWTRAAGSPAPAPNAVPLEAKDTLGGLPLAPGQALAAPAIGSPRGPRARRDARIPCHLEAVGHRLGTLGRLTPDSSSRARTAGLRPEPPSSSESAVATGSRCSDSRALACGSESTERRCLRQTCRPPA